MKLTIKVGSVTNAQRGARLLRSTGYKPLIKRIENPQDNDGCGYAIVVSSQGEEPVNILRKNRINVKGVEKE